MTITYKNSAFTLTREFITWDQAVSEGKRLYREMGLIGRLYIFSMYINTWINE